MNTGSNKALLALKILLRLSIVIVIAYGLYLNLYGGFGNQFQSWLLLFYTTQSNALVMLVFAILCAQNIREFFAAPSASNPCCTSARMEGIKTGLTWAISITGIVYHLLLVSELQRMAPEVTAQTGVVITPELWLSLDLLHTWSPLLAFMDWLLFSPKGTMRRFTPVKWLLIPLGYFVFICLWVNLVAPVKPEYTFTYPYPFLDFQANGLVETCKGLVVILLGMLVLGYLYLGLDKVLGKLFSFFSR
ncbi:MAG: Pr6Pr family membrane protein [Saezia sp.]